MHWDPWSNPQADTYSTSFPYRSRRKSSVVPGASILHEAIHPTFSTTLQNNLLSYLSYVKTQNIPILPVTKPDVRSVLGQGASFLVNGAENPKTYTDPSSGTVFPQGLIVAYKRAIVDRKDVKDMDELIECRIHILFNELLTMHHPPLRAHPNIVNLLGVGFDIEGENTALNAMPVLVPECAELGNFAEVLETARKEDRPLSFPAKISLCLDIAHGIEILHACDIVHGDVKCENVLIFERDEEDEDEEDEQATNIYCKLTDFGVSRLPEEQVQLGGSRPWQAPECTNASLFKIEEAKRTDVYSYGMLLWRVMLDGDPFKSLGEFEGKTPSERRRRRNEAIAALKDEDRLVQHVCESLALSERFSKAQLQVLSEVVSITLLKDSSKRELDIRRIVKLLTPNNWYQERHPAPPARMPLEVDANLLDLEKWHSEFESASPVVHKLIASGFRNLAQKRGEQFSHESEQKQSAAAYQLAVCYANGFGVPMHGEECLHWLSVAAGLGSQKAQEVMPNVAQALNLKIPAFDDPWAKLDENSSHLGSSWASSDFADHKKESTFSYAIDFAPRIKPPSRANTQPQISFIVAAESCNYEALEHLLSSNVKPAASVDGVSPLHFLSSWNVDKAEDLGRRLIAAGADVNAQAQRGSTVGGTPLMWSVFGDHISHSKILLKLGADPMTADASGEDALSFASRLHLKNHLRLLMENVRPAVFRDHIGRLLEAAAGGVSRFTRMIRHGENWTKTSDQTFDLLHRWNDVLSDEDNFVDLILPALRGSLQTPFGRMNTDVQMSLARKGGIKPVQVTDLLKDAVLTYNVDLFNTLLDLQVPINRKYDNGKNLLHLCAKIPDHNLAATAFAVPLLRLGAEVDVPDDNNVTPWMEAILERKWDLGDLYLQHGAEPLTVDKDGWNVMGLCIQTLNLGAIKYLFKYSKAKSRFLKEAIIVNPRRRLSALQLAASLPIPRGHGMKIEVTGVFLTILNTIITEQSQLDFRSDGYFPDATALDLAAALGNVSAVKSLVKRGALTASARTALTLIEARLPDAKEFMTRKNLERCKYIITEWPRDEEKTRKLAEDWTNMKTIDESKVNSSWEVVVINYKARKQIGLNVSQSSQSSLSQSQSQSQSTSQSK